MWRGLKVPTSDLSKVRRTPQPVEKPPVGLEPGPGVLAFSATLDGGRRHARTKYSPPQEGHPLAVILSEAKDQVKALILRFAQDDRGACALARMGDSLLAGGTMERAFAPLCNRSLETLVPA